LLCGLQGQENGTAKHANDAGASLEQSVHGVFADRDAIMPNGQRILVKHGMPGWPAPVCVFCVFCGSIFLSQRGGVTG
jgi:hypothetical protein